MADYYSLLARAVANLPKTSPPSARRAIYERARKALTNQLRSLKPQLPESDIAREERALDDAVNRLEAEFEPQTAEVHAMPVGAGAPVEEAPPPPAPPPAPRPPEAPVLRPPAPPPRPAAAPPPAPKPAPAPLRAPIPPAPTPLRPAAVAAVGLPYAAAFKGPLLAGAEPPAAAPSAPQPALGAALPADDEADDAPPLGAPVNRYEREPARPVLTDMPRRGAPTWVWIAGAVAFGFAISVAIVALWMRPALQDIAAPSPVDTPAAESSSEPKVLRRVGAPPTDAPSPTPTAEASAAPPPAPSPTATPSPPPAPVASAAPAPAPTPAPDTPAASPTPPAASSVPIASRAAMLVATVADAAKPAINVGTAVWSLIPAPAGQPQGVGVKAEVDVPDLKMHASMIMRKNFDASLPASHTIDLRVTFDAGSTIKGVKDIAIPLMRRDDPPASDALAGVRVKISDNYFLIGLNRGDGDVAKNIQEIAERGWFDFPMQLDDDRIAKLTFEKGSDGEKIVAQALAAWK
jgi:hypothetical protein